MTKRIPVRVRYSRAKNKKGFGGYLSGLKDYDAARAGRKGQVIVRLWDSGTAGFGKVIRRTIEKNNWL